jgi:CBS domain-containing protein
MSHSSTALVQATIEQLRRHAPFDRMASEALKLLAENAKIAYYAKDEAIVSAGQAEPLFHIVKQGSVSEQQEDEDWELSEGEGFPLSALLSGHPVGGHYRAREDVFCYEIPAAIFTALLHRSPQFQDFCTRYLANLLEQSRHSQQARYLASSGGEQSMNTPLGKIIRRNPISCAPATPLREVLETMRRLSIGSMVAVDGQQHPVGVFTLHDVLSRVALPQISLDTPFSEVMSHQPSSLPPTALACEAALMMARHGFRHVLVTEQGKLAGIVSEKDLFSLQRVGLRQLSDAIRRAAGVDDLQQAGQDIRQLGQNLQAQGVGAEPLTQIISTLNDVLTRRVIELEWRAAGVDEKQLCWLALGSEGRLEQTLTTDQDNGLIFLPRNGETPAQARQRLLPLCRRINEALDRCGFAWCKGNIMASNPEWCLTLEEWQNRFARWIDQGDPESLLNATIFFDFRPLHGDASQAETLRGWLAEKAAANPRFLHQMAANALRNRPPLGLVRTFVVDDQGRLDLKLNGVSPFVDAARIYALASGVSATNTIERLRLAGERLNIAAQEIANWIEALLYIQMLRLRGQEDAARQQQEISNYVKPDALSQLDRRILKESFRQSRALQARLALDYRL